jgi:hypothetical protein
MKRLLPAILAICLISFSSAAGTAKKVKLKGHLGDLSCASEKMEDPNYMRTQHTKKCFQMPACVKSGYGILLPGDTIVKFDQVGNEQAQKLIASATRDKDWRISVRGKQSGDSVQVTKLELEK